MRTGHWLMVVILTFGLGVGVGFVLTPMGGETRTTITQTIDADPATNERPLQMPEPTNSPEVQPPAQPTPTGDPLMDALKGLKFDEVPTVEGSITAGVHDADGNPLAGVELRLFPNFASDYGQRRYDFQGTDEEFWNSVNENELKPARALVRIWRSSLRATTNAEGRVEFAPLVDVPYWMACQHPDLKPDREPQQLKPGDHISWQAPRLSVVRVTVEPCPGVDKIKVHAREPLYTSSVIRRELQLDASPGETVEFQLQPGTWSIAASVEGSTHTCEPASIEVANDGKVHDITLRLRTVAQIRVEVIYKGGTPQSRDRVFYAPVRSDLTEDEHFNHRRDMALEMSTGAGRHYATGLEPGEYFIRALRWNTILETRRVYANPGNNVVYFEFDAPERASGIECVIEWPEGIRRTVPQFEAEIRYGVEGKPGTSVYTQPSGEVWNLGENRYLLMGVLDENRGGTLTAIEARITHLGSVRREVSSAKGQVLTFRFSKPASLTVTVEDIPERVRKYVSVRAGAPGSKSMHRETGYLQGAKASFSNLQPGTIDIVLRYSGLSHFELERISFELRSGEHREITLRMPALYELVIEGDQRKYDLGSLVVEGDESQNVPLHLDADGRCILPYIPGGTYTLKYGKRERTIVAKERTITIRSNTTVRLTD